ncbi:MAG: 2-oxoacid:acceptor oxidoreductase family protein [Flavobacteriaceae bacterium]|nr:2-oxoacid:acceptor oxidoreductase family protein [Flavobacteriaceae bacterium]
MKIKEKKAIRNCFVSTDESSVLDSANVGSADLLISAGPKLPEDLLDYLTEFSWVISDANSFDNILNYPERHEEYIKIKSRKNHILINASDIAAQHGDDRISGLVLLGAASNLLPLSESDFVKSIYKVFLAKKEELIKINIDSFRQGKIAAKEYLTTSPKSIA